MKIKQFFLVYPTPDHLQRIIFDLTTSLISGTDFAT